MIIKFLCFLVLVLQSKASSNPIGLQCIYIQHQTLQQSGFNMSAGISYDFDVTWNSAIDNISKVVISLNGFSLGGFQTYLSYQHSFRSLSNAKVTIQIEFTQLNQQGTMIFLQFDFLATTTQCASKVELSEHSNQLLSLEFHPSTLNDTTRGANSENFEFASNFTLEGSNQKAHYQAFISSFTFQMNQYEGQYMNVSIRKSPSNKMWVKVESTDGSTGVNFTQITFAMLAVDPTQYDPKVYLHYEYRVQEQGVCGNRNCSQITYMEGDNLDPVQISNTNCIFGLTTLQFIDSGLDVFYSVESIFIINSIQVVHKNMKSTNMSIVCYLQCGANQAVDQENIDYTCVDIPVTCVTPCLTCNGTGQYCTSCDTQTHVLNTSNSCVPIQCIQPCQDCDYDANNCTSCIPTHHLSGPNTCTASSCTSPCLTCAFNLSNCTECISTHQLSSPNTCTAISCVSTCLTCQYKATNCTSCPSVHLLSFDHECIPCDFGCTRCVSYSWNCQECDTSLGYKLIQDRCILCPTSQYYSLQEFDLRINPDMVCACENCMLICSSHILLCDTCMGSNSICATCLEGTRVFGGCTTMTGCLAVTQIDPNTPSHRTQCTECDSSSFVLIDGTCECKVPGHSLVDGVCIEVPVGCRTPAVQSGSVVCLICKTQLGFSLNSGVCVCQSDGYQIVNQACQQICGDGKVTELRCDDGNTVGGDGCSSACEIQTNYVCQGGSPTTPSQCVFRADIDIAIELMDGLGNNQGRISLSLTPETELFGQMNFQRTTHLFIDGNFQSITQTDYSSGSLGLTFRYAETVEGLNASLRISLDSNLVQCENPDMQNQSFSFVIASTGIQMVYSQSSDSEVTFETLFLTVCSGALIISLMGTWYSSMLGVETLTLLQVVYLLHFQTDHYTDSWKWLQGLSYSYGNLYYKVNQNSNIRLGDALDPMEYSSTNYIVSMTLAVSFLFIPLLSQEVLKIVTSSSDASLANNKRQRLIKMIREEKYQRTRGSQRLKNFTHLGCLSFFLFSYLQFFMIEDSSSTFFSSSVGVSIRIALMITLSMVVSQLFLNQTDGLRVRVSMIFGSPHPVYIRAYCLYLLATIAGMGPSLVGIKHPLKYSMCALCAVMIIWQSCRPTYADPLQKLCITYNMTVIAMFSAFMIFRDYFTSLFTEDIDLTVAQGVFSLVLIGVACSLVRVFRAMYLLKCADQYDLEQSFYKAFKFELETSQQENRKKIRRMNLFDTIEGEMRDWQDKNSLVETGSNPFSRFKRQAEFASPLFKRRNLSTNKQRSLMSRQKALINRQKGINEISEES